MCVGPLVGPMCALMVGDIKSEKTSVDMFYYIDLHIDRSL